MATILNSYSGTLAVGTTTKVVPLVSPTAGARALLFVSCPATQTAVSSGWSKYYTYLGNIEISVWTRILTGSETDFTFTQNGPVPVSYTVIEVPGDATLGTAVGVSSSGSYTALSGLPSESDNTVFYAMASESGSGVPSVTAVWTASTELFDVFAYSDTTPGAYLTVAHQTAVSTTTSAASVALSGDVGTGSRTGLYLGVYSAVEAPENAPPTADAGSSQTVAVGTMVTLNGSASSDSDGTIASYAWTRVSGPSTPTLSGTGASRTFTPTVAGTYVYRLVVTDDDGAVSAEDTVTITVTANPTFAPTVAEENTASGSAKSNWWTGLTGAGIPSFPRLTYYEPGETAQFSTNNQNAAFTTQIFRLGHYGNNGAREVQAPFSGTPATQPAPTTIAGSNGAVTCAAWSVNASWVVPADALPGWYMALFRDTPNSRIGFSLFCVSDKSSKRDVLIVSSDSTWHAAYNGFGGNNVYGASTSIGDISARALCSTYDKPVVTFDNVPQTHFFNNTYPYLKYSERLGVNAGHATIEQIKNDPTILDGRSLIVWTGHNEYVPQAVMDKTKSLLAAGQNMVNASANDFFWRAKFTDGAFGSTSNGRVMWCKKDTIAGPTAVRSGGAGTPFTTAADWTGTWQDTRWSNREPSEDFFGDRFIANGIRADKVKVPASMKTSPAWRNCSGVQALGVGSSYEFVAGTLGMEWDMPVMGNVNVEQIKFSESQVDLTGNASDINGENYGTTMNPATHAFTMVRNGSAYIANFNSDQWGWALDATHLRGTAAADINAMQMVANVLVDLGASLDSASVAAAGLTLPAPQPMSLYGFSNPDGHGTYFTDGVSGEWVQL